MRAIYPLRGIIIFKIFITNLSSKTLRDFEYTLQGITGVKLLIENIFKQF